jgi:hypothetical protein
VNGTGFMKLVLEENVDLLAARCPYFLERCVGAVVRAAIHVVNFSSPVARPQRQPLLTSSLLQRVASQATSRHTSFDVVWKALRLIRGVPSEVVTNISDRLGAGVLELIRSAVLVADTLFRLIAILLPTHAQVYARTGPRYYRGPLVPAVQPPVRRLVWRTWPTLCVERTDLSRGQRSHQRDKLHRLSTPRAAIRARVSWFGTLFCVIVDDG